MGTDRGVDMTTDEIDAFLGRGGTGVLTLARGDRPYATPISYGYVPASQRFYFRLGFGPSSDKREFAEPGGEARLVTYDGVEGGWTSVIAVGRLEPVEEDALTVETARALREAELPLLGVWGDRRDDVEFRIYRLEADELTGRTTASG